MFIDQTKLHTKTIVSIDGPLKTFNSNEGPRQKFNVTFQDGYKAEFCPLVSEVINIPKSGQDFTFKVRHRSSTKGDEIEAAAIEGYSAPGAKVGTGLVTMNGHPASIALTAALRHYEIEMNTGNKKELLPSDVMDYANNYLNWLISKQNQ